jgi:cellulose synthase/poly-beta-1,6-N-acetylglucosamine synthase-like glycosyltransferase
VEFEMIETLVIILTLTSGILVIYHHLGYPLILRWMQKWRTEPLVKANHRHYTSSAEDASLPTVTIIIPAFNEEQWIADKIRNLAIVDYPVGLLKIIIACDGCEDDTPAIATRTANEPECQHMVIEIRDFPCNRGKVAVINEVMQDVESDLVALSDVSALISIDALLIAAAHFEDPTIGVLNGHYCLLNPGSDGEAAYWNYQGHIKAGEASLGSTLGAHGAFYLFRRSLFSPLAADTINDDFILPMKIVAAGYLAKYENRILALEQEQANTNMDHQRRRRIAAGNCQQLLRLKRLMLPGQGGVAFAFISGKGLRVLMPFLMIIALIGCLVLAGDHVLFKALAALQLLVYLLAGWHILWQPSQSHRIIKTLAYLVSGHVAGLVGTLRYLGGFERGRWKRVGPG